MTKQLHIPFGKEGWQNLKNNFEESKRTNDMSKYILELIINEMEKENYSKTFIARQVFENALDYEAKKILKAIINYVRNGKVPKYINVDLDQEIPEIE